MKPKEARTVERYRKVLLQFIEGRGYKPLTFSQLFDRLDIFEEHRPLIQTALRSLRSEGRLRLEGRKYLPGKRDTEITGTIRILPRGFGFVRPQDRAAHPKDIFIAPLSLNGAVDSDTVEVRINPDSLSDPRGPEGVVVAIRERGRKQLAGTVVESRGRLKQRVLVPTVDQRHEILVEASVTEAPIGTRVLLNVQRWGGKEQPTLCTLERVIGHIDDPAADIPAALVEYSLRSRFPRRALEEARRFGSRVVPTDLQGREDLRNIPCVTIDPKSARDFDDALYLKRDQKGHYQLMVHIADVSHYVRPGTALDLEASQRSNSTYFPRVCVPMLPPELADNLCSLKPNVNRLAVTVKMEFDKEGKLLDHTIGRSVIRSAHRFTYEEVRDLLDGKGRSKHLKMLRDMAELGQLLRKVRRSRGSMEFALPEVSIEVDSKGRPRSTYLIEYDTSHQLVEEFMLKANEVIATHLDKLGRGLTYRVHAPPAPEELREFFQLARSFGFQLSKNPGPEEIQRLLDTAARSPLGHYVAVAYVRTMKLAAYSPDNIGHYGLSLEHYCHFTSPIRRYSDLIVHRVLFGEGPDEDELGALAERCSDQERVSSRAESSVLQLKKLRLLEQQWKEDSQRSWGAVVTDVKPHGVIFEVLDLMLEGFKHVSTLGVEYYEFDPKRRALIGNRTGENFHVGTRMWVEVEEIDLIERKVYWI